SPRRARGPSPKPHPRPPCLWCPGPKCPMLTIVHSSWGIESRRGGGPSARLVLSIFYRDISGGQATESPEAVPSLPLADVLKQEMMNRRVHISKAANELYDCREGTHDDLLLAVAIALWVGHQEPFVFEWVFG